jgi:GT2 family glycosyltransferase
MVAVDAHAPEISVIILTMNQLDKTIRCLSSFQSVTCPPFNILLWDNGSHDGTAEVVRELFPEVLMHYHPTNLGVASGRNAAAEMAIKTFNPSYLLFIDNDTVVTSGFLSSLLEPFGKDGKIAQTAPKIRLFSDRQRLEEAGGTEIRFWLGSIRVLGFGETDLGQYDEPKRCIAGGCTLIRAKIFREVGGFDPVFDPYGPEDLDFSLRIYEAGYYAQYVPQSIIFHDRSRTFVGKEYSEEYAKLKARHWFLLMKRHASPIEQLIFLLIGGPIMLIRAMIREGRKGNLGAIKGLINGIFDFLENL